MNCILYLLKCTAVALALIWAGPHPAAARGNAGDFDYYSLVLSWSPTYCEAEGRNRGGEQCSGGRPYAFVLHGLWPQWERSWPEFCRTRERPWVPRSTIDGMLDIMPSPKLVIHQYRKHGACSGLSPDDYFAAARKLYNGIKIPRRYLQLPEPITVTLDELERDFLDANPQLRPEMISIACRRNRVRELRICFSRDFKPRDCGANENQRKLCPADKLIMPPVRGRRPSGI